MDTVARILREHDFFVMAVHNHELFIQPNVYYLHCHSKHTQTCFARSNIFNCCMWA
ncbi:MAG: DUF1259 domain-containing protein [Ktedonobacteraceae bacterium]